MHLADGARREEDGHANDRELVPRFDDLEVELRPRKVRAASEIRMRERAAAKELVCVCVA